MFRDTNRESVVRVGKDDVLASEIRERCPVGLDRFKCQMITKDVPFSKREVSNDPAWLQRYRRATSREKIKIEDEAILDFLTRNRKRRGLIGRNQEIKAAAEPLNRLERLLDKTIEKRRGRPRVDRQKVSFYLNTDFLKYLEDYSQKNGYLSVQDAVRWMLREFLRYNGYPVGQTLGK
jgi:hypothetical protein